MKIAFDGKRAFYNTSGLGNYSRNTILLLNKFYKENEYYIVKPSYIKPLKYNPGSEINVIVPNYFTGLFFNRFWRSYLVVKRLLKENIDIYHGLSNELPAYINYSKIKSVVTIHDLIFLRYPQMYRKHDIFIYNKKFKYSSLISDRIIAISNQTKEDLINFYQIKEEKIDVIYQGCDNIFYERYDEFTKEQIRIKYNLPATYLLYVGTIELRKNLLLIIQALKTKEIDIPLVVVGRPTDYLNKVKKYIYNHKLENKVHFYHQVDFASLPGFYQMAEMLIYPSFFEGFGIPIVEALVSKIPVITSVGSCFAESAGESSLFINPGNVDSLIEAINKILSDKEFKNKMIIDGFEHSGRFSDQSIAKNLMSVYNKIII